MGKKRVIKKTGGEKAGAKSGSTISRVLKRKLASGTLHIQSTYNNTRVSLTDKEGNMIAATSCGSLGFKGAKKGTPFAAAKAGETVGEKSKMVGVKDVNVIVNGVGAGRESAIRAFLSTSGADISSMKDVTPVPHNGPRPKKPRRV